jgi:HEAT repeat protein
LAKQVLIAGLQDENLDVRLACCHALGQRADADTVTVLRGTLENDAALDVQLAVVDALGKIKSPESVAALAVAVNDRDPALQYAAVQSLKSISGKQLGNEVAAWRAYAASPNPEISVADRSSGWSPF